MSMERVRAPELTGGLGWLNTKAPLKLGDLRGKVVLLDFWTFCCANCMHVIPDLKRLEAEYPRELVVIGVHSAKFDNEKETDNIRNAIIRYGIEHPVVNDANFQIWQSYGVRSWPTLVLIDPDGYVVGAVSGEGHANLLDAKIKTLIKQFAASGRLNRSPINLHLEGDKVQDAALSFPGKIAADPTSNRLFISDSGHNRIVICTSQGEVLDVIGSGKVGKDDGTFQNASFHHPQGVVHHQNILYVADTENHLIRAVDLLAKQVSTVAGTGKQAAWGAGGGRALETELNSPWDLVFKDNKLYIAMAGCHQLWLLDLASGGVQPFAGNGREDLIDGSLASCSLAQPSGITTDGQQIFFADSEVSAVRRCSLTPPQRVDTIIGVGLFDFGDRDGKGKAVRLQHPLGVLWRAGKLYVADSYNHKIKSLDPGSATVSTLSGTGKAGWKDGKRAEFSEPGGLTSIGDRLYVADTNNNRIRSIQISTGDVSTLNIEAQRGFGTVAASESMVPNALLLNGSTVDVQPNAAGHIMVSIFLPPECHLNADAPLSWTARGEGDAVVVGEKSSTSDMKPTLTFQIPIRTEGEGKTGVVHIQLTVYYCRGKDNIGLCKMTTVKIRRPIRVVGTAKNADIPLDCTITE